AATAGSHFFIGTIPISGGQHTGTALDTKQAIDPAWPDWSPDGTKIVFSNNGCRICPSAGLPSNVFVLDRSLGTVTQLTFATAPNNYIQPHWDPDQDSIAFTNAPLTGGPGSIYTMNSAGTGITCVIGSVAAPMSLARRIMRLLPGNRNNADSRTAGRAASGRLHFLRAP
ncbi:MAG: hypothetical protein DMD83_24085, partial [Candidatus Rokuibacteriota bacterium]